MDAQYPGTATKIDAVQKDPISLPPSKKGASPGSTVTSENDDKASANLKDAENNDVIVKRDNDGGNIEEDD